MQITVAERIFYSTVLIEAQLSNGKTTSATAFFYGAPLSNDTDVLLLVTNKHVLSDARTFRVHMHAGNYLAPKPGQRYSFQFTEGTFRVLEHPDPKVDVAAVNISPHIEDLQRSTYFLYIGSILSLSPTTDENLIGALEQIRFVGYPQGMFDAANYLPISRTGYTASPLLNDYEGIPAFLIDASVFPGSSGSPVFILDTGGMYQTRDGTSHSGGRCIFLGVLAAFQTRQISGQVVRLPASTLFKVEEALDLGLVFKASTVDRLVDDLLQGSGLSRRAE